MDGRTTVILWGIAILLVIVVEILLVMVPVRMAKKRGRSQLGWGFVGFLGTLSIVIIILACLGETERKRRKRIMEEEAWRSMM